MFSALHQLFLNRVSRSSNDFNYCFPLKGYTGNGTIAGCRRVRCRDRPCYAGVPCFETTNGAVCGPCPTGLTGNGTRSGCQTVVSRARRLRCSDGPCFTEVTCRDTADGFVCGPCPDGYSGDGTARGCRRVLVPRSTDAVKHMALPRSCRDKPCYRGVRCSNTRTGFKCGPCPKGGVWCTVGVLLEAVGDAVSRTMSCFPLLKCWRFSVAVT